jgi:8-oxo-dGTP pyrophosphatase MutT (NUDIX family)
MSTDPALPVEAAVLAPVYRGADGKVRLVLIFRGPRGVHGSQIGLPGGRREPEDVDLLATALREADEEIGLPPGDVEVLCPLPVVSTATTGYEIAPFLGRLPNGPPPWRRQESEVDAVLEVPLEDLARPDAHGEDFQQFPGWPEPRRRPFYRVGEHRLWGATYRIVHPLLPRLLAGEWEI